MEKQNPFSLYDFLGYFVPGAIALFGVIIFLSLLRTPQDYPTLLEPLSIFGRAELYFPFILLAYVVGHTLSFISSITIERYSVWSVGYPSKFLLNLEHPGFFTIKRLRRRRIAGRLFTCLLILPVTVCDLIFGRGCGMRNLYARNLDPLLVEILTKKINTFAKDKAKVEGAGSANEDIFRFVYHYTVEHAKAHLPKMQNYVALYGFLRTLSFLSVAFFWSSVWIMATGKLSTEASLWLAMFFAATSYLLFMDFMKFYRRFSLESLMALAAIYPNNKEAINSDEA